MRKSLLMFILATLLMIPLGGYARNYDVTFNNDNAVSALNILKKETGYDFVYRKELVGGIKNSISGNYRNSSLEEILNNVITGQMGLDYEVIDNTVILRKATPTAKKSILTGTVTDENGEPVIGASVMLVGSKTGVATNIDGQFSLRDVPANGTIQITYIGYRTSTVKINGRKQIAINLVPDEKTLDEVVVVGYGTSTVKDFTGSVASIGERTLGQLNAPNSSQMLQNLAAGVQVSSGTGVPGETVRVRVRGATSLTGSNEPLYVIDGIPVESASVLDNIPSSDIKSMDVLKDASAAAIYGSRAANGVVIVTTKQGQTDQKPTVSFNYNVTTDKQINNFRILYGDEWRETIRRFARETLVFDPSNDYANSILEEGSTDLGTYNTNWFDLVKQTAIRHNANLSVTGGSKNSKYLMSIAIMDQKGMVIGDHLKRYSARMSAEASVLPILRFGMNANMTYTNNQNANTSLFSAQGTRPDYSPYYEDGSYDLSTGKNPVADLEKKNNRDNYIIMGTVYGEVDILKGLKFRTSLSGTLGHTDSESFSPAIISTRKIANGSETHSRNSKTIFDNTLNYNTRIKDIHVIDAMVGLSYEKYITRSQSISGDTYPDDEIFTNIGSAANVTRWSSSYSSSGLFSSFARINYRLMDCYLFTFTGRYDGSSMFGSNNRYGFFPSGAIAWRINN